jgi:hypothetical protein
MFLNIPNSSDAFLRYRFHTQANYIALTAAHAPPLFSKRVLNKLHYIIGNPHTCSRQGENARTI